MSSITITQQNQSASHLPWTIRALNYLFKLPFRSDFTVNRRLLSFFDRKIPPSSSPSNGVISSDFSFASIPDLWIRLYTPHSHSEISLPVVVFFHGGGFVFGSPDSSPIDSFSRDFARELNSIVISVNYRLAPEHRFPSQYDDGFNVLKFIDEGLISDSIPPTADFSRCFIAGESAGGNIAHHVTLRAISKTHDRFKKLKIVGVIEIQPFFGGEERTESELRYGYGTGLTLEMADWYWKAFLPVGSNRDHPAANVVGSNSVDISGLDFPPVLVIVGGLDQLKDRDVEYCEWLKKSGQEVDKIEYPNASHGFIWFSNVPEYCILMQDVTEFVWKSKFCT